jgi:hypothetical protein
VQLNGKGEKRNGRQLPQMISGAVLRVANTCGRRRTATTSTEHSPCYEGGHREHGQRAGPGDRPGHSNENGPLTCGPRPLNNFSNFQTPLKILNSKRKPLLTQKIFKLCMLLYWNALNNCLHWVDFKFSTEFTL